MYSTLTDGGIQPLNVRLREEVTVLAKPSRSMYTNISVKEQLKRGIDKILQEKQLLFDEIVDDVSIDLKSKLTSEELFGLFGLTPPEKQSPHDKAPKPQQNIPDESSETLMQRQYCRWQGKVRESALTESFTTLIQTRILLLVGA